VEGLAGLAELRVLQIAFLAAGAAHEHGSHPECMVFGARGRTLRGLVVGMGVHGEEG
jgi:hypothetical protein